jgi:hypothetical protein
LVAAGVEIPTKDGEPDATLEISPLFAVDESHLKARRDLPRSVARGAAVYLGE